MAHAPHPPILVILALSLALAACGTPIRVAVDVDPDANIAAHETYSWISSEPLIRQVDGVTEGPRISPIDDGRIRRAVDTRLQELGWQRGDDREVADLIVSYGIGAEEKTEIYETPSGGPYHGRFGYGYGGWYGGSTVRSMQYTEGTLTVEFFDRRTKQAVWVGWASKRLSSSDDRGAVIEEAIGKILQTFPARR
jgi:hypothetical protein